MQQAIFHDVEQNTEEWFDLRVGKLGGSSIKTVMANYGKAFGDPAKRYAASLAREQITGKASHNSYTNEHMDRGHEQEPEARMEYEEKFFVDVQNGGYFELGNIGCSPDGLVYDDGIVEIKSQLDHIHFDCIKRQSFDPTYKWQYLFNLMVTGRKWLDYISYCPDFPDDKRIYVYRIYADNYKDEMNMIDDRLKLFFELVDSYKKVITESEYTIYESPSK